MENVFACVYCKSKYATKRLQQKCMTWCKEHPNECNAELIEYMLDKQEEE